MQLRSAVRSPAGAKLFLAARGGRPYLELVSEPQISLTQSAAKRVAWIASRQHKPAILRLAVDGGGCAGFTYKFELAPGAEGDDAIAETDGVKLVVDPFSLELVKGSAVDFVEDLGGAAFKVTNPNAQSGCGCGSSFSV
ncbi:MAG: iron-sulfur cluster insertion protein [Gaiellaceae bacterium]|nr:iron-sulfur cluster insertion protein [Gaiellaceae bacterium]